jgi:hypothetical protein
MTAAGRLAAILAADVVGYSRLMGEDGAAYAHAGKMDEAKAALNTSPIFRPCSTASARRDCRRNEASLKAARGNGCDARRLSSGRSIRAWRPHRAQIPPPEGGAQLTGRLKGLAGRLEPMRACLRLEGLLAACRT